MTDRAPADAQRALGVLFWFRNDLRLHDQPALTQAIALANARGTWLLPVWVHDAGGLYTRAQGQPVAPCLPKAIQLFVIQAALLCSLPTTISPCRWRA